MSKKKVIAGGGLVLNPNQEILLIFRRGFWDLPKGKLDKGETIEACAIREVCEETGIKQATIERFICITEHDYFDKWKQKDLIKQSHWYLMHTNQVNLKPQTSEDIEQAIWVSKDNLHKYLPLMYTTIQEVFAKAF